MIPPFNPALAFRLVLQTTLMMAEAQQVIAMRMLGMAGLWRVTRSENGRMVSEKMAAAAAAGQAAGAAMARGAAPQAVALAALKPVRARTRANAARLSRRGPGTPA